MQMDWHRNGVFYGQTDSRTAQGICAEYPQFFYEENGMQKRETREVDDSAPEMGLAAALKLRNFFICMYICSFFRLHVYPYGFVWLQHADDHRNDL